MDYGEQTYRRLYGRGGLSDQLNAAVGLRGLGTVTAEDMARISSVMSQRLMARPEEIARQAAAARGRASASVPAQAYDCGCIVANLELDEVTAQELTAQCAADPVTFAQVMSTQGISLECPPEWYAQPRTWAIVGGAAVIGALAWWALA